MPDPIRLDRYAYTEMGTFGKLHVAEAVLHTIERPWLGNRQNISCVPEGTYPLQRCRYNRGGYMAYELLDVPGRDLIKIHIANTIMGIKGCIAPGLGLGIVKNKWAVVNSGKAFRRFMYLMDDIEHSRIDIRFVSPEVPDADYFRNAS